MSDYQRYAAENFIWITTYITLSFSRGMSVEELDLWGNVLSAVGSNLSALAVMIPAPSQENGNTNSD